MKSYERITLVILRSKLQSYSNQVLTPDNRVKLKLGLMAKMIDFCATHKSGLQHINVKYIQYISVISCTCPGVIALSGCFVVIQTDPSGFRVTQQGAE